MSANMSEQMSECASERTSMSVHCQECNFHQAPLYLSVVEGEVLSRMNGKWCKMASGMSPAKLQTTLRGPISYREDK